MKIPSFRSRDVSVERRVEAQAGGAGGESVTEPPHEHPEGCPCLQRCAEQSGEIQSGGSAIRGSSRPAPARPLTGFFTNPGYNPPTVIVSDLLNFGSNVDIMLMEQDQPPSVRTLSGLSTEEVAAAIRARRASRPTEEPAAPARAPQHTEDLTAPACARRTFQVTEEAVAAAQARRAFQPPTRVSFEPFPRRRPTSPEDAPRAVSRAVPSNR